MATEPVIGIDLGTTNSAVAVVQAGRASIIRRGDDRIIPSVVAALPDGQILVGRRAKELRTIDAAQVVSSSKRLMGRRFGAPEVQRMVQNVPYSLVEGPNESVLIELGGRLHSPVEIAAHILRYLREMAEEALRSPVQKAVIAVPANFTDGQRSATRIAARLADLEVIRIINEPTAAALAYGYVEDIDRRIAVYDFGGGTFDVTILQITRNVFEVLATSGEMFLGGDDIDEIIAGLMADAFVMRHGTSVREEPAAMERLRTAAEALKIELSEKLEASIHIDDVLPGRSFDFSLAEATLRRHVAPLIERTAPVCADALSAAKVAPEQIDEIVLVGGTTRLAMVQELVQRVFGRMPQTSINPISVVAVGAAIQGAALVGSLLPAGPGDAGGKQGSAVLIDVTPRSLGVRTVGGFVDVVIPRNTTIPVEQTRLFTTTADHQTVVQVRVCQGESEEFAANYRLGELSLTGLRDAPRGEVTIAVTFEINADGMLEVRAKDQDTGQLQHAFMRVVGGMSEAEIRSGDRSADDATAITALSAAGGRG